MKQKVKSNDGMRLAKYMAMSGVASRRKCEEIILEGRVSVNGKAILTPVQLVQAGHDTVTLDGHTLEVCDKIYLMLNKPAGYTCSAMDVHAERLVYELLPKKLGRLFSIGRLDRDSDGLLIMTNDGAFTQNISHPSHGVEKTYVVDCEGCLSGEQRRKMLDGIHDEGEFLKPNSVIEKHYLRSHTEIEIILEEGKKREVRRLCKAVGLEINRLTRTHYGTLELGNLASGKWRNLKPQEISELLANTKKK
ncbi:MAG: pseudouridine synthase [Lentisphaeria bacterium]